MALDVLEKVGLDPEAYRKMKIFPGSVAKGLVEAFELGEKHSLYFLGGGFALQVRCLPHLTGALINFLDDAFVQFLSIIKDYALLFEESFYPLFC